MMPPHHANVRRQNAQALRFPGVVLYFQFYPGVHGQPVNRGIVDVPFRVFIQNTFSHGGRTDAEGRATIPLRPWETSFDIEIFGRRTTFEVADNISALTLPPNMNAMQGGDTHAALTGVSQRLTMLGYMRGPAAGTNTMTEEVDKAILDFQANEGLVPNGVLTSNAITLLQRRVGV